MENTLNDKISIKSVYISVNNNTNFNMFWFFLLRSLGWIKPKNHLMLLSFAIAHKILVIYIPVSNRRPGFKKTNLNKKHEAKNTIVQSVFMVDGTQGNGLCQSNQFFYLRF